MPGKILIVDDLPTNRILLRVRLLTACYEVFQAASASEAIDIIAKNKPDLVLINAKLGQSDGLALCRRITGATAGKLGTSNNLVTIGLASDPVSKGDLDDADMRPGVLMLTPDANDRLRLSALQAGATDVLTFPGDDVLLQARLRSLMRAGDMAQQGQLRDATHRTLGYSEPENLFTAPARICIIADDPRPARLWQHQLAGRYKGQVSQHDSHSFLKDLRTGVPPDLCLILVTKPLPGHGLRLLSELRAHPETRHAASLVLLPAHDPNRAADALDLGAGDVLTGAFTLAELTLRMDNLVRQKRLADQLRSTLQDGLRAAITDPLTGLYNRRYAMPHLARMSDHARRSGRHFAVMLADLDHFKTINDKYGHAAGDSVLIEVAQRLRANLRAVDLIARIGGEEFLIALPDTERTEARIAARRLCRIIAQDPFALPGSDLRVPITLSIGVTMGLQTQADSHPLSLDHVQALLQQADRALYGAKSCGRNQVTLSKPAA